MATWPSRTCQLIQRALDLGWTLFAYEADIARAPMEIVAKGTTTREFTNWRELEQARNLVAVLDQLGSDEQLLVWCGNGHHTKRQAGDWAPMGYQFVELAGLEPFCIDQTITVVWPDGRQMFPVPADLESALVTRGGSAGFLRQDFPPLVRHPADALVVSVDNAMA